MNKFFNVVSLFLVLFIKGYCQKQDRVWLFGDGAGIDFNDSLNPVSFFSGLDGKFGLFNFACLSKDNGSLLLYAVADSMALYGVNLYNSNLSIVTGGAGLAGHPNYSQGLLLLPMPNNDSLVYLFNIGDNGLIDRGLNYSIINLNKNLGQGEVIMKDISLISIMVNMRINALRHGNGRDWWILGQIFDTDLYYRILLTPYGLEGPYFQAIPAFNSYHFFLGTMAFSSSGSKLASVAQNNSRIQLCDFDRCSGLLSNCQEFGEGIFSEENSYYGVAFSL